MRAVHYLSVVLTAPRDPRLLSCYVAEITMVVRGTLSLFWLLHLA